MDAHIIGRCTTGQGFGSTGSSLEEFSLVQGIAVSVWGRDKAQTETRRAVGSGVPRL